MAERQRFDHLLRRQKTAARIDTALIVGFVGSGVAKLYLLIGLALLSQGCIFNNDGVPADPTNDAATPFPDAAVPDAMVVVPDAMVIPDAMAPDAMMMPTMLADDGLIARYFINEASMGTTPVELLDATADPEPLFISYIDALAFTEVGGNRGLLWPAAGATDRAGLNSIAGTKIATNLNGSRRGTIEVVARVDATAGGPGVSRLLHIGEATEFGFFTLAAASPDELQMFMNGSDTEPVGAWPIADHMMQRIVIHAVFDSEQLDPADRVRLYVNGARVASTGGTPPVQDAVIDFGTTSVFYLGNRVGVWSIGGVMFYAALYGDALSDQAIADNAFLLEMNDDSQP